MKKFLVASVAVTALCGTPALAADMPVKAPAYKAAAPYDPWTGCYVGGNVGYGQASETVVSDASGLSGKDTAKGIAGGLQSGCDYQSGNWIFGFQDLFDWTGMNRVFVLSTPIATQTLTTKLSWFDALTARIGYVVERQSLIYIKGGAVWAHNKFADEVTTIIGTSFSTGKSTRSGWTVGGGIERMFAPNWSAFVEYDYANFGRRTESLTFPGGLVETFPIKQNLQTVLVGVNYRFGDWGKGPVSAKY